MKRMLSGILLIACIVLMGVPRADAQNSPAFYDYVRSDLQWFTIETDHFLIHYHSDSTGAGSRTARVVSRVAEDIYEPITSLYDYRPDTKVSFILKDFEDYSNGAAYFLDNMIEIWAPALDSPLRGEHAWLRNVISHEFTHMVQVQKTMKLDRRVPFFYLQYLDYENVRRPDVLYGFPNVIATYPVPILNNPAWLAEGTAQFGRDDLSYDRWDTHRDMLLRTQILAGQELSLADMGGFYSHTSLMRESVYNHGFAFTQYLAGRFGEEVLRDISASLARWKNWNFERAAEDATGIHGQVLYDDWIRELRTYYSAAVRPIRQSESSGRIVEPEGFYNLYPRISPDGRRVAYVSNRGQDFSRTALYVRDLSAETTSGTTVRAGAESTSKYRAATNTEAASEYGAGASAEGASGSATGAGPLETNGNTLRKIGSSGLFGDGRSYTCSLGHTIVHRGPGGAVSVAADPVAARADGPIQWHPFGDRILYIRTKDTPEGNLYADLYEIHLEEEDPVQLTRNARAADPVYTGDGDSIVFVTQSDGTTNLARWDRSADSVSVLTDFTDGSQIREPVVDPSGSWIYFGLGSTHGRDIARIPVSGGEVEMIIASGADERQPAFDRDGRLIFASDTSGIFNLYRLEASGSHTPLTNEIGGAFMPDAGPAGRIAYSTYTADGYKIAVIEDPQAVPRPPVWHSPDILFKQGDSPEPPVSLGAGASDAAVGADRRPAPKAYDPDALNIADDSDVTAFESADEQREYNPVFTSFSFLPVLRLDRYVSRRRSRTDVRLPDRTRAETLWRNTKTGFYTSTREVLGGLSMFGGILVGPGSGSAESLGDFLAPSNVLKLERDIFLQFDYARGLGIIDKRWAPQLSIELFNVRRNVENGLSIEEVRCTACYPDTSLADLSYNLWEVDFVARSKINRSTLAEIGYRYSPYRVTTERFFSEELQQSIPESSERYFIGRTFHARVYYEAFSSYRDMDVVPHGVRLEAGWDRENGRLLESFDLEDGFLQPVYNSEVINRLSLSARAGVRLGADAESGAHGIGARLHASTILGGPIDDFYDDYVGGLTGARGYPFYALGGNETLWMQTSYTFPIAPRVRKQRGFTYIDKIYMRLYADAALAWTGDFPGIGDTRKDAGAEIRFGLGSYYLLPTAVFVSGTYGFDSFDFQLDEGFVTPDGRTSVRYGGDLLWHVGILFGFEQL